MLSGSVPLLALTGAALGAALALYQVSLQRRKFLDLLDWPLSLTDPLPEPPLGDTQRVAQEIALLLRADTHEHALTSTAPILPVPDRTAAAALLVREEMAGAPPLPPCDLPAAPPELSQPAEGRRISPSLAESYANTDP